jgi:geranylgeranyl transferase type-1 subunit beta
MPQLPPPSPFDKPRQIKFWKRCSTLLPQDYTTGDAGRVSLGFFIVAALDLLSVLETSIQSSERTSWINWIYSCQVPSGGFRGFPGTDLGSLRNEGNCHWDPASLPNTYLALLTLVILGDDLEKVERKECLQWLGKLQRANGSFGEFQGENGEVLGKDDLRTCYCAAGIAYLLQADHDQLPFDEAALRRFVSNCQGHDGGFGQSPLLEGHSGLNFCAIAALGCLDRRKKSNQAQSEQSASATASKYSDGWIDINANIEWILQRQTTWVEDEDESASEADDEAPNSTQNQDDTQPISSSDSIPDDILPIPDPAAGFNGRPNKMADTCYCFWNAGALAILSDSSAHHNHNHSHDLSTLLNIPSLHYYLAKTQHVIGGYSKAPGAPPDVMHSYLGLAALALHSSAGPGEERLDLKDLHPVFVISRDAARRIEGLNWKVTWSADGMERKLGDQEASTRQQCLVYAFHFSKKLLVGHQSSPTRRFLNACSALKYGFTRSQLCGSCCRRRWRCCPTLPQYAGSG